MEGNTLKNFNTNENTEVVKVSIDTPYACTKVSKGLISAISDIHYLHKRLIFICIGSDRSTGDSLGPLVGTELKKHVSREITVLGDLDNTVHAINLNDTLKEINKKTDLVIAIDACLGNYTSVGHVAVNIGPLMPGAGVNKKLTPVGNIHINGIVNVKGFMEYAVLQNTRLSLVIRMSEFITSAIISCLPEYFRLKSSSRKTENSILQELPSKTYL